MRSIAGLACGAALAALLAACDEEELNYPIPQMPHVPEKYTNDKPSSVFGEGGLDLFGGPTKKPGEGEGGGIGVNAYLWRATLDTISFIPLSSADPFGGVIITDWYTPPEARNERFKLTIFILDRQLRADGIRVSVFRQVRNENGDWSDAPVDVKTAADMENAILAKARELRLTDTANKG